MPLNLMPSENVLLLSLGKKSNRFLKPFKKKAKDETKAALQRLTLDGVDLEAAEETFVKEQSKISKSR